jgi:hypothetical protein
MFALWFDSIRVFFQQLAESQQLTPIPLHIENGKKVKPVTQRR